MEIKEYIDSGVLEAYVLGSASETEARELFNLKNKHYQIKNALDEVEEDLERIAEQMAITPPPGTWSKIEERVNEIINRPDPGALKITTHPKAKYKDNTKTDGGQFIEVAGASSHMRIHKAWRWVFAAVFILGKIFLGFAIYFYLENRQMQQQIEELKTELKQTSRP